MKKKTRRFCVINHYNYVFKGKINNKQLFIFNNLKD